MALKKEITTASGIVVPDAYHRVERVILATKTKIHFVVSAYKDDGIKAPITSKPYTCDYALDGSNPIAQAYVHLKTLPDFAGAQDC